MRKIIQNKYNAYKNRSRRITAFLLVFSLFLSQLNTGFLVTYAADGDSVTFHVGTHVEASLSSGVLTLSGSGDTYDYSADTAPFQEYEESIHALIIEEGITYIGSFLFYNLGNLEGELVLPESITGFGEYAFSGDNLEKAPRFTLLRNLFKSAEIIKEIETEQTTDPDFGRTDYETESSEQTEVTTAVTESDNTQTDQDETKQQGSETEQQGSRAETTQQGSETETEQQASAEEETERQEPFETEIFPASEKEEASVTETELEEENIEIIPSEGEQQDNGTDSFSEVALKQNKTTKVKSLFEYLMGQPFVLTAYAAPFSENGTEESAVLITETITKQKIENPDTLFYKGQDGAVFCPSENSTFLEAALSAGYQQADRLIAVTLDDTEKMELPEVNEKIMLPECPESIRNSHENDGLFTYEFAGWAKTRTEEITDAIAPGEAFFVGESENISLYSVWEAVSKYRFKAEARLQADTAVYTLSEENADGAVKAPAGYVFLYQWQLSKRGDKETADWKDIEGAVDVEYSRLAETSDNEMQFRCAVTAVKLSRSRSLNESVTLYSDAVNAAVTETIVYVDQNNGSDTNEGSSKEYPVQTFDRAAALLRTKEEGGTVDNNVIIVIGTYKFRGPQIFTNRFCPVTIKGETGSILHNTATSGNNDYPLELQNDICFESIEIDNINHIYGGGNDITFNQNVTSNMEFYLYGSGQNQLTPTVGKIAVYSGKFTRIVGYVRSSSEIDVEGKEAHIIVDGSANVQTIVAGSASGGVKNAKVMIEIKGGTVNSLLGGNQGFSTNSSPFTGETHIHITGGKIGNIWSAGTGRNVSIPTFCGKIQIDVDKGEIGNIYGAGSAAYVVSSESERSKIAINVTGGTINNIFAAGRGGDDAVRENKDTVNGVLQKFPESTNKNFGSLSGDIGITMEGGTVSGNIYAGGEGYKFEYAKENAFLDGNAVITVKGDSTVKGNIYGGGKGLTVSEYENCARVERNSSVKVKMEGGTVEGNIFGGGENAVMMCSSSVEISGGLIEGNVYGGGEHGLVEQKTAVNLSNGTVNGSVYGGALGIPGEKLVYGGATVNITGGWIRGNLYGGSELSDDGPQGGEPKDLVFVNFAGGTVSGNVFGGGYKGTVNGSTHLHIGQKAPDDCNYYKGHLSEKPGMGASLISIEGSVYAGGDYGGGGTIDYTKITVEGTSHVYIDGTGYNTGDSAENLPDMAIAGGVFGSGASCDAGSTRLVTLKNFGAPVKESGVVTGATKTLKAIQRADKVLLNNAHVRLTGRSDVANSNQTALYSLNRIGDHEEIESSLERGLVLQGGSTLVLDSEVIEMANFYSQDQNGSPVELDKISDAPNTIRFESGTVFRVSYTKQPGSASEEKKEIYGKVSGYAYMLAGNSTDAYAYARSKEGANSEDGGFANSKGEELTYYTVNDRSYRYWKLGDADTVKAERQTVLTAQTLEGNAGGYSVAKGTIDLPPVNETHTYTINNVTLPTGLTLAEAAINDAGSWGITGAGNSSVDQEKERIREDPLNTFGLFMYAGSDFVQPSTGKIISNSSALTGGENSLIGQKTPGTLSAGNPQLEFYLTYYNDGISISKSLGTVIIELKRDDNALVNMNVEIVTKASALEDQVVDLYATENGSYTGSLTIPAGESRSLILTNVVKGSSSSGELVDKNTALSGKKFSITMQPEKSQGWNAAGLITVPFDLYGYKENTPIGTTDSRYEATIEFTLRNAAGFEAQPDPDQVILTIADGSEQIKVTLNVHWEESVVSEVNIMPGRQYNEMSGEASVAVSQESSVTVEFTLGSKENSENLWLELRKKGSFERIPLPAQTWITLWDSADFYCYQVSGSEKDHKITLLQFTKMWANDSFKETIASGSKLNVIVDFGAAGAKLPPGEYSLRLRNEQSADSMGAEFTLNNNAADASISVEEGASANSRKIKLKINRSSDTRLAEGAGIVLSVKDIQIFPEGVIFRYNGKAYYPVGGKVYIPVKAIEYADIEVEMANTNAAGLPEGKYAVQADIYPAGQSAGAVQTAVCNTAAEITVTAKPIYSMKVGLKDGSAGRIVKKGTVLEFSADYAVKGVQTLPVAIKVEVQKKNKGGYEGITQWAVEGNSGITDSDAEGTQTISVTIPSQNIAPGTYRLLFKLGDQETPYNIIIEE